jgi:hypothetical protein
MMIVGLSTPAYDADGARIIRRPAADQELENNQGGRRVSRVATLDGGCVVNDAGYSASDRTYIIKTPDDDGSMAAWAERIVQNYSEIKLASRHGFFVGTPSRWWCRDGFLYIEILIITQED